MSYWIKCVLGTDRLTNITCVNKLAKTAAVTDIRFSHIIGTEMFKKNRWFEELTNTTDLTCITSSCVMGTERLLIFTGLTIWLTLLTLIWLS